MESSRLQHGSEEVLVTMTRGLRVATDASLEKPHFQWEGIGTKTSTNSPTESRVEEA